MGNEFTRIAALDFGIQFACFPVAYLMQTEKFYDLAGAATHIAVTAYATKLFKVNHTRGLVQAAMISMWTLRLGSYLAYRGMVEGDRRFNQIKTSPTRYFTAWTLQGVWAMSNLAPSLIMMSLAAARRQPIGLRDYLGWGLFAFGFAVETVADVQKWNFRQNADNAGRFIDSGLWSLSRHPNYFGELALWTGLFISASSAFNRPLHYALAALGPMFNFSLILFVSGVPMLEASGRKRWGNDPQYLRYLRDVPVLIPFVHFPTKWD